MSSGVSLEEEKKQMDLWRVITIVGKKKKEQASDDVACFFFLPLALSLSPRPCLAFLFLVALSRFSGMLYAKAKRRETVECDKKTNERREIIIALRPLSLSLNPSSTSTPL